MMAFPGQVPFLAELCSKAIAGGPWLLKGLARKVKVEGNYLLRPDAEVVVVVAPSPARPCRRTAAPLPSPPPPAASSSPTLDVARGHPRFDPILLAAGALLTVADIQSAPRVSMASI